MKNCLSLWKKVNLCVCVCVCVLMVLADYPRPHFSWTISILTNNTYMLLLSFSVTLHAFWKKKRPHDVSFQTGTLYTPLYWASFSLAFQTHTWVCNTVFTITCTSTFLPTQHKLLKLITDSFLSTALSHFHINWHPPYTTVKLTVHVKHIWCCIISSLSC